MLYLGFGKQGAESGRVLLRKRFELKSAKFKDTVHQVCMSHARNKFVKAANQGGEQNAVSFSDDMKELFEKERSYNEAGLTPAERLKERQGMATKEIIIRIRSRLDSELANDSELRSRYYTEALNYLDRQQSCRTDHPQVDHPTEQFVSLR